MIMIQTLSPLTLSGILRKVGGHTRAVEQAALSWSITFSRSDT